jgi:hypothetical protein
MSIAATVLVVRVEIAHSNIRHPVSLETHGLSLNQPPVDSVRVALGRRAHSNTQKAACSLRPFTVGSQPPHQ